MEPDTYLATVTSTGLWAKCQHDMTPQTQALLAALAQTLSDGDKAPGSLLPLSRRHRLGKAHLPAPVVRSRALMYAGPSPSPGGPCPR